MEKSRVEMFDKNLFLTFVEEMKEDFKNRLPICQIKQKFGDSSLCAMSDEEQLLFSVSN